MYTCDTELSCLVLIQRTSPTCRPFYIASFPRLDYIPCSSLTYFEHINFIYLTIMLIYSVLTTIILPINENTISSTLILGSPHQSRYLEDLCINVKLHLRFFTSSLFYLQFSHIRFLV